eukprot:1156014-Pelagomonas_calceolata.AAC.9
MVFVVYSVPLIDSALPLCPRPKKVPACLGICCHLEANFFEASDCKYDKLFEAGFDELLMEHVYEKLDCSSPCLSHQHEEEHVQNPGNLAHPWKVKAKICPLHMAASSKSLSSLKLLLDLGAVVDQRDAEGWTAMHYSELSWFLCLHASCSENPGLCLCLLLLCALSVLSPLLCRICACVLVEDLAWPALGAPTSLISPPMIWHASYHVNRLTFYTPCYVPAAAIVGWDEGARLLLEYRADPNVVSLFDSTPILMSVKVRVAFACNHAAFDDQKFTLSVKDNAASA